jgi:hypothetical protein
MKAIFEKHITLLRKDVELATIKRMSEFASDVFAAVNTNATTRHGLSSQPVASTYVASSPTTCAPIISPPRDKEPAFLEEVVNISDPSCSKQTPSTQFWEEASRIADEVEKSGGKTTNRPYLSPSTTMQVHPITETSGAGCRGVDIECPTFDLLPAGETWTQHFAATNQPSPRVEGGQTSSSLATTSKQPNFADVGQSSDSGLQHSSFCTPFIKSKYLASQPFNHCNHNITHMLSIIHVSRFIDRASYAS